LGVFFFEQCEAKKCPVTLLWKNGRALRYL
jgi:hypothetical protein